MGELRQASWKEDFGEIWGLLKVLIRVANG